MQRFRKTRIPYEDKKYLSGKPALLDAAIIKVEKHKMEEDD